MRYFHLLPLLLLLNGGGCKKKRNLTLRSEASPVVNTIIEVSDTKALFLPDFGIYITNWPKSWVLANHGTGCGALNNSVSFIFGSPYETVGTMRVERTANLEADYFSTFEVTKREVWNNGKSVDFDLETVDGGKVKLQFLNLKKSYEKWAIENIVLLPPFEDTAIDEVTFPNFPIYAPKKAQQINMLLGFNVLTSSRDYQISFQNQISRLGVSCTLREELKGSVSVSFDNSGHKLEHGDVITIEALEENILWEILREEDRLVVTETENNKRKTLYKIPISEDYDFAFYPKED